MVTLHLSREKLARIIIYLNKAEARDQICRAIQYGSKFLSGGKHGIAHNVDKHTSLARKVFRLLKFLKDYEAFISPLPNGTPLLLVLLKKSKNALSSTYFFLDQIVWLGRSGIYKSKVGTEIIRRISLFCLLGSCVCTTAIEIFELGRLSSSIKKRRKNPKDDDENLQKSKERSLELIKSSMDILVAIGQLRLAPMIVTPRVTGAFGFITSLMSCYQLFPSRLKFKSP